MPTNMTNMTIFMSLKYYVSGSATLTTSKSLSLIGSALAQS